MSADERAVIARETKRHEMALLRDLRRVASCRVSARLLERLCLAGLVYNAGQTFTPKGIETLAELESRYGAD